MSRAVFIISVHISLLNLLPDLKKKKLLSITLYSAWQNERGKMYFKKIKMDQFINKVDLMPLCENKEACLQILGKNFRRTTR